MPVITCPVHILTAAVDIENKKSPEAKAAEEAEVKDFPKPELVPSIRMRHNQKASLELIEAITRYLFCETDMSAFTVQCGYHPSGQWNIWVSFGKEEMTDQERFVIRQHIISLFLDGAMHAIELETDMLVKNADDFPSQLCLKWNRVFRKWYCPEFKWHVRCWDHLTDISVYDRRIFILLHDYYANETETDIEAYIATLHKDRRLKSWFKSSVNLEDRAELTLDEAIRKLKTRSRQEEWDIGLEQRIRNKYSHYRPRSDEEILQ